jgi:hypothetical protein
MKKYHIFFLLLKIIILVQFGLIIAKKLSFDSKLYILTEIVFKTCLSIFIEIFLFHTINDEILIEDKVIISFAGGLLFFDAWFNDFPRLLQLYNIDLKKANQ